MAGIELRHKLEVNADPLTVYKAIASQTGQASWWTPDCSVEETVGSIAQFWFYERQFSFSMRIQALVPGKRVEWRCVSENDEWTDTTISFELTPKDGKTIVRLTHSGWRAVTDYQAGCNYTWSQILGRMKGYVESGKPNPYFTRSGMSV